MTILNPEHLLQQADRLLRAVSPGPPRQVDVRRAESAAYYGLFHFTLTALADEVVGITLRTTSRYALVYRAIDHSALKKLCVEASLPRPSRKFRPYVPSAGLGPDIHSFAVAVVELQDRRHLADYDPLSRLRPRDARLAIATARSAITRFKAAPPENQKLFLTLLLCPPR